MVDAAHQHLGIGRHAMALLEAELRTAGHEALEVSFVPVERGARGFWERCGFTDTGRLHYGEPVYRKDPCSSPSDRRATGPASPRAPTGRRRRLAWTVAE